MWAQVILFCALLFGSKFVVSIPLDEELGQQRAFESNIWQGTQNEAEPYHGTDFTLAHSGALAQQVPTSHELKINPETQHSEIYGINEYPVPLKALPARTVPVNFASGTNERRHDSFVTPDHSYPSRNQNQQIIAENHFQQQNWQPQNRLENVAQSAIGDAAVHDRPLAVQNNFQNSGQPAHIQPVIRPYYQTDNRHQIERDVHYHPVPQEPGNFRYISHSATNSETNVVPVRYENYQDAHAHNINKVNHGYNDYKGNGPAFPGNANPRNFETYNRPPIVNNLNNPGSYVVPPSSINNNNANVAPTHGFNQFNNRYIHNPSLPSNRPPIGFGNPAPNFNYRYVENAAGNSVPSHHVIGAYNAPKPLPAIVEESDKSRFIQKPFVNNKPNNLAPVNTFNVENPVLQTGSVVLPNTPNTASNDSPFSEITINHNDFKKITEGQKLNDFNNLPGGNTNGNLYRFPDGENAKKYFLNKIKKNFVIIYANGTVEYVNNLHNNEEPEYILLKNDNPEDSNTNVTPENREPPLNNQDAIPDKIDSSISGVAKDNDDNNNEPIIEIDDAHKLPSLLLPVNDNNNLLPITQENQETTPLTVLELASIDQSSSSVLLDNHKPLSSPYIPPMHNIPTVNDDSRYHHKVINYPSRFPPTHLSHISKTDVPPTTTPTPDDAMIQQFLDSLSNSSDEDQPTNDNLTDDGLAPVNNSDQTLSETHTTIQPPKLHTVISPGIFRSTTGTINSPAGVKNQDSSTIKPISPILNPNRNDENTDIYQTTPIPFNNGSDSSLGSTTADQIITISPIELATDNVKNGLDTNTETTTVEVNVDSKQQVNKVEDVQQKNDTTSSAPSNPNVSPKAGNVDNAQKTVTDGVKNTTKSACKDCNDPATLDDNTAATTNEPAVNTGDSHSGDNSLESQPTTNGLEIKLNIPSDAEGTLYIKVDAPEGYTGNDDEPNDETLLVTVTKQNTSNTDSVPATKDSNVHDDSNKVPTNSDESNPYQNLKLDLSNALVVMNRTNDKDYLNQLLPSDSKVNLFIFQMPCQDEARVEKYREVTFYANGTCVEQLTETRWKNKDDPSPVIITTKRIHGDGKCN